MNLLKKIKEKREQKRIMKEEYQTIKEDYLYNRAKLMFINDKVDDYIKNDKNIYTSMREITNVVKGW